MSPAEQSISRRTERGSISFLMEVEIYGPGQAAAFAEAMTGNDDDVILAAETAMRERLGRPHDPELEELEIGVPDESAVRDTLRRFATGVLG